MTWEQIFKWPGEWPTPTVQCPAAWQGDSIAVLFADRECARLMVNAFFEPPITEKEIEKYSRQFKMPKRQAELDIRRRRDGLIKV